MTLKSGEKKTIAFQIVGGKTGEHRVKVQVNCDDLASALSFEGSAYCYKSTGSTPQRTAQGSGIYRAR